MSEMVQTLCGTPSEVRNLVVNPGQNFYSLQVMWDPPTLRNGNPNNIQYMVIIVYQFRNLLLLSCNLIGPSEVTKQLSYL